MTASAKAVLVSDPVIVPPKASAEIKFRWQPELIADSKVIAQNSRRSDSEASELLMQWALGELEAGRIVVPPKSAPKPVKYTWKADTIAKLKAIADRTGRSDNEVGEMLMEKAVAAARHEYALVAETAPQPAPRRRKGKK